jgi:hypothetical protein
MYNVSHNVGVDSGFAWDTRRVVRVDPGARDGATLAPARPRPCSIQTSHCVAYPRVLH